MTRLLLIPAFSILLMAGSCPNPNIEPAYQGPLFCDVEEARRFTREEWDIRATRWPENLSKDIKTNLTWDRECLEQIK